MSFLQNDFPNASYYNSDLRELIAMYKTLVASYTELVTGYETLEKQVNDVYAYVDTEIANGLASTIATVNAQMAIINARMLALSTEMSATFASERVLTDSQIAELESKLETEIGEVIQELHYNVTALNTRIDKLNLELAPIFNPTTANMESIQKTAFDIWNIGNFNAMTCAEYDASMLSCDQFAGKGISCNDFATESKTALSPLPVFNPVSGFRDTVQNVLATLSTQGAVNPVTSNEFDIAELTDIQFDALNMSCNDYDFNAKAFI